MQQTIKNTTSELLASLPQEHVYYTPSDFKQAGFPDYLINRIQLEVDRNLAESISLPESDWVDLKAENVQEAWDKFLSAIKAESRVPSSYVYSVIESAVEDVIDQLTQPRSYILDALIGEKSATLFQIQGRKHWVVAYPVLAEALIRYMQRKELESITRDKALHVLKHVDDKLAENYTPLKWAQHLDPVFTLLNNEAPSALFVRFFKDRDLSEFARWIDAGPEFLSRSAFIERISTVGTLPETDIEETAPHLDTVPEENTKSPEETDLFSTDASIENELEDEVFEQEDASEVGPDAHQDFHVDEDQPVTVTLDEVLAEESDPEQPLFAQFLNDDIEVETETVDTQSDQETKLDGDDTELDSDPVSVDPADEEITEEELTGFSLADSFIQSNHDTTIVDTQIELPETPSNDSDSPDFELDEPDDTPPIIDASSDDEHVIYLTDRAKKLLDLLEPHFETFVVELFLNDELDFYKHLENIVAYDQWRSAGRYITRDIFDRNRIDIYSEPAVLFTDTVQEFFDQNA